MQSTRPNLGIIAALPAEAHAAGAADAPVGDIVTVADGVVLVRCGIGRDRAARATGDLLAAGCRAIMSWGTAAALDPEAAPGDLYLPAEVLARDGRRYAADEAWRARIRDLPALGGPCGEGTLAEAESVLRNADDKGLLHTLSGALVADMESAAVAEACAAAGVPFVVARAVSDSASARLPECALAAVSRDGDVSPMRCLGRLLLAPTDLPALVRLAAGFRAGCRSLARLARLSGPGFQAPGD